MPYDFCPSRIALDTDVCELFDTWSDVYFFGLIRIEICSYRCESGRIISRTRSRFLGLTVDGPANSIFDPSKPPPQAGGPCKPSNTLGAISCELAESWDLKFFGGLMRVRICIYSCADGTFYHSRWQTRILGIPLPWRERSSFPNPI